MLTAQCKQHELTRKLTSFKTSHYPCYLLQLSHCAIVYQAYAPLTGPTIPHVHRKFLSAAWQCTYWLFDTSGFCNWKYYRIGW